MGKNAHAVDTLGSAIVAGRFGAGGVLPPEPLLCEELGVSRTVVREAVKSLVAMGLILTGPKVGTRVQPAEYWNWFDPDVIGWQSRAGLSPEFVRDLQDLRLIVEPAAVRLAALRANAADVQAMEDAFAGMQRAVDEGGDYVSFDLRFHQGLLRASHNRMLAHMGRALSALLRTSFEISTVMKDGPRGSLPMHRAVLDAVIAQNPDGAERALLTLIEGAHQDIELVLHSRSAAQRPHHPATTTVAAARRRTMAVAVPVHPLSPTNRQEIHP
ncbi:MAG: FadR family transcriptional regulator [Betaproteobacteria bacterium]|nr:FadR family transcriptional regulator [Betaproteobacteria bacterium]